MARMPAGSGFRVIGTDESVPQCGDVVEFRFSV